MGYDSFFFSSRFILYLRRLFPDGFLRTDVGGVLLFILSFSWLTALMGMVATVFLRER